MGRPIFQFGNIVVVDDGQIGVIVKTWKNISDSFFYAVYVRNYNNVRQFSEEEIHHYVYSKSLHEDEHDFYILGKQEA